MNPLLTNRRIYTCLLLCPFDESTPKWKKYAFTIATYAAIIMELILIIDSFLFFWWNFSSNIDGAFYGFAVIGGFQRVTHSMIAALILRHKINGIFDSLKIIYKKCEFEKLCKIICK